MNEGCTHCHQNEEFWTQKRLWGEEYRSGISLQGKEKQIKREGKKGHRNSKLETFWRIFFVLHICTCNRTSYLHFTVMFLLPPQFGHFPIQPTLLIIPRAEGVCQKLKIFPSLASVGAVETSNNTWWNLGKAAEPQLRGLMFSQSLSCRITLYFWLFFKLKIVVNIYN